MAVVGKLVKKNWRETAIHKRRNNTQNNKKKHTEYTNWKDIRNKNTNIIKDIKKKQVE